MTISEIVENLENELMTDNGHNYIFLIESHTTLGRVMALIFGLLITIIWIMFPIIISLEICYIAIPTMQFGVNTLEEKFKTKGHLASVIGFTFKDARKAIESSVTGQTNLPPLAVYLKLKLKSAMFAAFIVALVVGNGNRLLDIVGGLMKGLLDLLGV